MSVAVLTVLWTPYAAWWAIRGNDMTESGLFWVGFRYLPLVAWAPLLAGVTLSYQRRSRRQPGAKLQRTDSHEGYTRHGEQLDDTAFGPRGTDQEVQGTPRRPRPGRRRARPPRRRHDR